MPRRSATWNPRNIIVVVAFRTFRRSHCPVAPSRAALATLLTFRLVLPSVSSRCAVHAPLNQHALFKSPADLPARALGWRRERGHVHGQPRVSSSHSHRFITSAQTRVSILQCCRCCWRLSSATTVFTALLDTHAPGSAAAGAAARQGGGKEQRPAACLHGHSVSATDGCLRRRSSCERYPLRLSCSLLFPALPVTAVSEYGGRQLTDRFVWPLIPIAGS